MNIIAVSTTRSLGFEIKFAFCDKFHLLNDKQREEYYIWKRANQNKKVNDWIGWKIYK